MQIPPQEDWSPELLSELQRAVPVLESTSFDLGRTPTPTRGSAGGLRGLTASQDAIVAGLSLGGASSRTSVGPSDGGARWRGWAAAASGGGAAASLGHQSGQAAPTDPLSEDAMALPRSTLTSGKRRTYPNRSTFQAHVCCVMDPAQVPRVLELLQDGPQFQTVRSWSYAYRIISPFDGQVHECSEDASDPGAGEKILGLLTRMGLENLLLIVSRWDSGPTNRLGTELFRCINEQCKDLLRELQQAVRTSFPPEELLGGRADASSAGTGRRGTEDLGELFALGDAGDEGWLDMGPDYFADLYTGAADARAVLRPTVPAVDLDALGPRAPSELLLAARGLCASPPRVRPRPRAEGGGARSARLSPRPAREDPASLRATWANGAGEGLQVQRCALAERSAERQAGGREKKPSAAATPRVKFEGGGDSSSDGVTFFMGERYGNMDSGLPLRKRTDDDARDSTLSRMNSDDLLRLSNMLRGERADLEDALQDYSRDGVVLKRLHTHLQKEVGNFRRQITAGRQRGKLLRAAGAMATRPSPRG